MFLLLGFGAYFRNEDAKLIAWLTNNLNIIDAFDLSVRYHPATFRPLYEILLRIIYISSGSNPLAFQVVSGLFFVGAISFFYKIAKILQNKNVAFLVILAFFLNYFFIFHFLFTSLQGMQYPIELFFATGAIFFMIKGLKTGTFINYCFPVNIMLTVLAIFTHPTSAFLLPLLNATLMNKQELPALLAQGS